MTNRYPFWAKLIYYFLTALLILIFLSPLIWALWVSFSPIAGTAQVDGYGFGHYIRLFGYGEGIGRYLANSLIISCVAVIATMIATTTGGYAFARYNFKGKNFSFILVLSVMMVPYAALLIPLIVWMKDLHMQNNLVAIGVLLALFQLPFGTFMMRNSFAGVPKEIEEAALIDGCSTLGAFGRVMLPAVRPAIVSVALLTFLFAWNDFMVALYLLSSKNAPMPLALVNMRVVGAQGAVDYGITTAGVMVLTVPAVVLFLSLQKYYVRGFTSGAVKG